MQLSNELIQKIVKERPKRNLLQKAINHELRLRLHTETILEKRELGKPYKDFIKWLGNNGTDKPVLLEQGKVDRLDQLIQTPIQTIELSESMFSRLSRIFHSQDGFFAYEFKGDEGDDWDSFKDYQFWSTIGFEAMQSAINSVWVVDLPEEQKGDKPEPQNRLVNIENVIDIEVDKKNNCQWVIFSEGDMVYVYDNEFIRAYSYTDGKLSSVPIYEKAHELGYTPARMFWSERLDSRDNVNKESPITKVLTDLDWLLFHMTSKKYLDIANAYPILVSYDMEGDFEDDFKKKKSGLGPGEIITVDMPREGDPDLMANPIKYINPDVTTLEWHVSEEGRLMNKVFKSVVGIDQVQRNDSAKNEMQVGESYESQSSVLMRIKKNFEIIHRFADETICKLRYGDAFEGCTIDYGTKHFLKTAEDLYEDYKQAKDSGASDMILSEISENIIDTRFRDNNAGRTRAGIINDLDPLPEKTVDECIKIYEAGGIDRLNFIKKMNLNNFIKRFERENLPLNMWALKRDYDERIDSINEILDKYGKERISQELPG